jgi:hypothetical protein
MQSFHPAITYKSLSLSSPSPSLVVVVIAHVAAKCVGVQLGVGHGQLEL